MSPASALASSPLVELRSTVAELILDQLKREGVRAVFGIPGGPATPLFDALYHEPAIRTISTRHEAGAAFMACGYARVSGRLGVCCLTTGPGTTNAVTGIAAAKMDSLPVLALTAQVATSTFGKGSLQDSTSFGIDTVDMLKPLTKMSAMLSSPANAGMMLRQGLRLAMTGRRGPVHLNIPTDLMKRSIPLELLRPDSYRAVARTFDREAIKEAAVALLAARRPAILAGHGVNLAGARAELRELAELLSAPVATTPKGKGAFPERHPLSLRVFGIASAPQAEAYLLSGGVDVLLILGSGLHEISTQGWETRLQPSAALIQQDIDPAVIGRNYPVTTALVGDCRTTLREMIFHLRRHLRIGEHPPGGDCASFARWKEAAVPVLDAERRESSAVPLLPQRVMAEIDSVLPEDALIFLDVGNHALWALHHLTSTGRNDFIQNWGEFAAMGFGIAAAIGGKLAAPQRPVVAISGDGGFAMTGMEVLTATTYDIPVVWIVLNDARFNCVHHGQQMQYAGRTIATEFRRMDIAGIAESLGAVGRRVERPGEISAALAEALASDRPTVLDVRIDADEVPPIHSRVRSLERFFAGQGR